MPLRRLTKFLTVVPEANMKLIKTLRIMKSIKKTQGKGSIDSLMKSTWYSLHDKSRQVIFGVQMIQKIPNHCLKRGSSRQFPNKKRQSESQIKCSQTSVTKN